MGRHGNARRNYTDDIRILVDTTWNQRLLEHIAVLPLCPDNTDIMILQPAFTSNLDAALALQASKLRPKAVMGLTGSTNAAIQAKTVCSSPTTYKMFPFILS